jgi:mRNA interferase MazF
MPGFEPWQVLRVPFPYADRPVRAHRPALLIALPHAEAAPAVAWLLMITSAGNAGWPGDVPIEPHRTAGLPAPSVVRTAKVASVDLTQLEAIGRLPARTRAAVIAQVAAHLHAMLEA